MLIHNSFSVSTTPYIRNSIIVHVIFHIFSLSMTFFHIFSFIRIFSCSVVTVPKQKLLSIYWQKNLYLSGELQKILPMKVSYLKLSACWQCFTFQFLVVWAIFSRFFFFSFLKFPNNFIYWTKPIWSNNRNRTQNKCIWLVENWMTNIKYLF